MALYYSHLAENIKSFNFSYQAKLPRVVSVESIIMKLL